MTPRCTRRSFPGRPDVTRIPSPRLYHTAAWREAERAIRRAGKRPPQLAPIGSRVLPRASRPADPRLPPRRRGALLRLRRLLLPHVAGDVRAGAVATGVLRPQRLGGT